MSGGQYEYCHLAFMNGRYSDAVGSLEDMLTDVEASGLDIQARIPVMAAFKTIIDTNADLIDPLLLQVMKAFEWLESGDWGEESVYRAIEAWQAGEGRVWHSAVVEPEKPVVPLYAPGDVFLDRAGNYNWLLESPSKCIYTVAVRLLTWKIEQLTRPHLASLERVDPVNDLLRVDAPEWLNLPESRPFDEIPKGGV